MDRSSSTTNILGFAVMLIRYRQGEHRAFSDLTFYYHIAAVPCGNFFDEGEAEAETALLPGFFVPAAIELFEYFRSFVFRYSKTLVLFLESDGPIPVQDANLDRRACRTVLDGIRHKIRQRLV